MMKVLHEARGKTCWITIQEDEAARYLHLDGCEEGAMWLASEAPLFHYLWFHTLSRCVENPRRLLVLGAGAFTAAKCLAIAHPDADVDAVDVEPDLGPLARKWFRLDEPRFERVRFHGVAVERFWLTRPAPYDFILDDMFDGFQHVPITSTGQDHFAMLRQQLTDGGVCVKNTIWDPRRAASRATCEAAVAGLRAAFEARAVLALDSEMRGHNRLLIGRRGGSFDWEAARPLVACGGFPPELADAIRLIE